MDYEAIKVSKYDPSCSICRDQVGKDRAGVKDIDLCNLHAQAIAVSVRTAESAPADNGEELETLRSALNVLWGQAKCIVTNDSATAKWYTDALVVLDRLAARPQPKESAKDIVALVERLNSLAVVDEIEYGVDPTASLPIDKAAALIQSTFEQMLSALNSAILETIEKEKQG